MSKSDKEKSGGFLFEAVSALILAAAMGVPVLISFSIVRLLKSLTMDICHRYQMTNGSTFFVMLFQFLLITFLLCQLEVVILHRTSLMRRVKAMMARIKDRDRGIKDA
jgi:hypothetical protein